MSIAETATKLPLATWAKILGLHPLHFEQVGYTPNDRNTALCDEATLQHAWQESDRVGREDIARAIAEAEAMIEQELGYRLIPSWESDEWKMAAQPYQPELVIYNGRDIRGRASNVRASWKKILTGGVEQKSLLAASAAITWDALGADLFRYGTVTVNLPSTAPLECQVEAYYPGHAGEDAYQIRPIDVSITGLVATITIRRELCVIEDLLEALTTRAAVYATDGDFLDEIDVYWRRNNPATQATLMWTPSGPCSVCGDVGCVLCAYTVQTGCLILQSTPMGGVLGWSPGEYVVATDSFSPLTLALGRSPDIVRLYYYAGNIAPVGCPRDMEMKWARAVTYLSISLLDRPLCDCQTNVWQYWREDLALLSGGDDNQTNTYSFSVRNQAGSCPFGTRRGALYAWQRVGQPNVAAVRSGVLL